MTKYLISFPSEAMDLSDEELAAAGVDSRAVIEEAKAAGCHVAQELREFWYDPAS